MNAGPPAVGPNAGELRLGLELPAPLLGMKGCAVERKGAPALVGAVVGTPVPPEPALFSGAPSPLGCNG